MIADVAFTLHQSLDLLMGMDLDEVAQWHQQCGRIARQMGGKEGS